LREGGREDDRYCRVQQIALFLHERAQARPHAGVELGGPDIGGIFVEDPFDELDRAAEVLE
jgi:hypothetical protein